MLIESKKLASDGFASLWIRGCYHSVRNIIEVGMALIYLNTDGFPPYGPCVLRSYYYVGTYTIEFQLRTRFMYCTCHPYDLDLFWLTAESRRAPCSSLIVASDLSAIFAVLLGIKNLCTVQSKNGGDC
jgi:hypothetical protein